MQPWYDLAASYLAAGQTDQALNVYRAILERAPEETEAARDQLDPPQRELTAVITRILFTLLIVYTVLLGATYAGILDAQLRLLNVILVGVVLVVWLWSRRRWQWHRTPLDAAILLWITGFALSLITNLDSWRRIADWLVVHGAVHRHLVHPSRRAGEPARCAASGWSMRC